MSTPTKRLSLEDQHLLTRPPILNQPTGKYRWIIASGVSFGGTGGVGYISIKNFIDGATGTGVILGAGTLICAGACAYCLYRFVDALRTRIIETITPIFDENVGKTNATGLRVIYNRLNTLLNETALIDLEEMIDDSRLPDAIDQQLLELEQMLPDMRQQLAEMRESILAAMNNRSMESRSGSAFNSPSHDSSFEYGIVGRLNALSKQVGTDKLSRNSSRQQSTYSSPVVSGIRPNFIDTSPIGSSKVQKLDLNKVINNSNESDSD